MPPSTCRQRIGPSEMRNPVVLAFYVLPGLVTAAEPYEGYAVGHGSAFLMALHARNAKAVAILFWRSRPYFPAATTPIASDLPATS
jgi:hypothetical protein